MASDADLEELLSSTVGGTVTRKRRPKTLVERGLWVLALIPWLTLASLFVMVLRVRLAEGVWPVFNDPDPKTLGLQNTLTILGVIGSFVAVVVVPLLTLVAFITGQRHISLRPLAVVGLGFLALVLVLRLDPGGIGSWLAD